MQKTDILTTKANGRLCFLWGRSIQRTANLRSWEVSVMKLIDRIALVLVILGGLNWGCVGIFGLDLVAALFGGSASVLSRSEKRVPQIRRHALFFSSVSDQNEGIS